MVLIVTRMKTTLFCYVMLCSVAVGYGGSESI
jgi:hypothetical protein